MQRTLVLLFIFGLTACSPIDKDLENAVTGVLRDGPFRNSLIEGQLRNLLEDLRQIMITGNDDVPVLDPLELPHLEIADNYVTAPIIYPLPAEIPEFFLSVNDLTLSKLSTFAINELSVARTTLIPLRYRVTFNFDVPILEIDADQYDLKANVEDFTIFGNGNAKINLVQPGISGNVVARVRTGSGMLYLSLDSVNVRVTLEGFDSRITGLLGGDESLGAFIDTFLGIFVPEAVKFYEEDISNVLNELILEIGNDILAELNLFDILG